MVSGSGDDPSWGHPQGSNPSHAAAGSGRRKACRSPSEVLTSASFADLQQVNHTILHCMGFPVIPESLPESEMCEGWTSCIWSWRYQSCLEIGTLGRRVRVPARTSSGSGTAVATSTLSAQAVCDSPSPQPPARALTAASELDRAGSPSGTDCGCLVLQAARPAVPIATASSASTSAPESNSPPSPPPSPAENSSGLPQPRPQKAVLLEQAHTPSPRPPNVARCCNEIGASSSFATRVTYPHVRLRLKGLYEDAAQPPPPQAQTVQAPSTSTSIMLL